MPVQAVVKIVLGTVGNILGFTASVLGVVDSWPARAASRPTRPRWRSVIWDLLQWRGWACQLGAAGHRA